MDDASTAPEHTNGGGNKFEDFSSEKEPSTPVEQEPLSASPFSRGSARPFVHHQAFQFRRNS